MAGGIAVADYRKGFLAVLDTIIEESRGYFLDPGAALFETLASVSAEDASRPVGGHGTTLAALTNHLRFYLDVLIDEIRTGEQRPVDWPSSWAIGAVTDAEWRDLLARLRTTHGQVRAYVQARDDWDEWAVADLFAVVGHCAYHLGEIRLALGILRGVHR